MIEVGDVVRLEKRHFSGESRLYDERGNEWVFLEPTCYDEDGNVMITPPFLRTDDSGEYRRALAEYGRRKR